MTGPDPTVLRRVAGKLLGQDTGSNVVWRQAAVTAVSAGPPPTVTIEIAGEIVAGVRRLEGYAPTVGDTVAVVVVNGTALIVIDAIAE